VVYEGGARKLQREERVGGEDGSNLSEIRTKTRSRTG